MSIISYDPEGGLTIANPITGDAVFKYIPDQNRVVVFNRDLGAIGAFSATSANIENNTTTGSLTTDDETVNNSITYPDGSTITTSPSTGSAYSDTTGLRVSLSSDQAVSGGTTTKVQFDNVQFDIGNEWDTSNYELNPNSSGVYMIEITLSPNTTPVDDGERVAVKCAKNGGDIFEGVNVAANGEQFSGQVLGLAQLDTSDTLSAKVFYDGDDSSLDGSDRLTHISVVRVA